MSNDDLVYWCDKCGRNHFYTSKIGMEHMKAPEATPKGEREIGEGLTERSSSPSESSVSPGSEAPVTPKQITEEEIMAWAQEDPKFAVTLATFSEIQAQVKSQGTVIQGLMEKPRKPEGAENPLAFLDGYVDKGDIKDLVKEVVAMLKGEEGGGSRQSKLAVMISEKVMEREDRRLEAMAARIAGAITGDLEFKVGPKPPELDEQ